MAFDSIQDGGAFAVMPPLVFGYGNAAGVDAFVQDRGRIGYGELNNQAQNLVNELRGRPEFSPYTMYSSF